MTTVGANAVSARASNDVVEGSRRTVKSGFPRRSLGLFVSAIGSSEPDAFAVAAVAFAEFGGLGEVGVRAAGGAGVVAGLCWSFSLFLSPSLLSELSESA